jgi:F0F1-type ATP synthase membrane subunit c/vacuolar-type H+-ATPase subunit K
MVAPAIASPVIAALMGIAGAIGTGIGVMKIGDSMIEGVAPNFHQKHIGKLK